MCKRMLHSMLIFIVQSILLKMITTLNNKCKHIFIPMKCSEMLIVQRAMAIMS